ncbi:MAG: group II truncated hemoglobin [Bacteroidetes bacterium]|nr:group II truncated hemoglobin [Bacteroidota bacterium]
MEKNIPTLYEWVGGEETLQRLFRLFYDKVLQDPLIGPVFRNMAADHPRHVAHFVAEVFGGPTKYTGEDKGSHAIMIAHHIGKMLDDQKRQRWIQLLLATADEIGIPDDPEFRSSLVGYLEWGSRIAVINSKLTENPVNDMEPMPRWGWGETGGPYVPE